MTTLPQPRSFVSSLISSLPNTDSTTATSSNPLFNASNDTRKALLTLHVLFPNELLPALDLLDRGLVTHLIVKDQDEATQQRSPPGDGPQQHQRSRGDLVHRATKEQNETTQQRAPSNAQPGRAQEHRSSVSHRTSPGHGSLSNLRHIRDGFTDSQPPSRVQSSNTEREVGSLLRHVEVSGQLELGGDGLRQPAGLESPDRLREVWRRSQGQGQVWARSDQTQDQLREKEQYREAQDQLGEPAQQHRATEEQDPSSQPQGQTGREREVLHRSEPWPLLEKPSGSEAAHQESERTTEVSNETTIRRRQSTHDQDSPLQRRASRGDQGQEHNLRDQIAHTAATKRTTASAAQGSAPNHQAQEHHHQSPGQALLNSESTLHGHPHNNPLQSLEPEDPALSHRRQRRLRSSSASKGIYMVRSAQVQASSRHGRASAQAQSFAHPGAHYEVRVEAWSCSCPAFVFAAFPAAKSELNDTTRRQETGDRGERSGVWRFGGLTLGTDMPVCKHLLACALVEFSGLFQELVEDKDVSTEELAGWAAGWGD